MASISEAKPQRRPQPIASGPGQSDNERGIGNNQLLNVERKVNGHETENVEEESGTNIKWSEGKRSVKRMPEWIEGVGPGE
jgi:hypothetical protein